MFLMSQHLFMVILVSFIKHVVIGRTPFYRKLNIIFRTSNQLERVHLLVIEPSTVTKVLKVTLQKLQKSRKIVFLAK